MQRSAREEGISGADRAIGVALLMLAMVVEGYDLQAANYAGPSIMATFGITRAQLGPLLSASLFGILIGSTLFAPLGDRFGRKRIVVLSSVIYGLLSLLASMAWTVDQLFVLRLLIGIGLGGVVPNALTMAGEMFEEHRQASMTALVGIGITIGGAIGGLVSAQVLPVFHWQGVFAIGGVLPLVIALIVGLALRDRPVDQGPDAGAVRLPRLSVAAILAPPLRGTTLLVWLIFAAVALNLHLLSSWIPLLLKETGFSTAAAAGVTATFHIGGVLGGITASLALARGGWRAIAGFAVGAAMVMVLLAILSPSIAGTMALIILAGFFVTGMQNGINGACAGLYPIRLRATGLGWALGLARVGAILGPLVGSAASIWGLDKDHHFFALPVVPLALVVALALLLARHVSAAPAPTHR